MRRSADFCETRHFHNFWLPPYFNADNLAMPSATLIDLPPIIPDIISRSPDILIFYMGSSDLLSHNVSVFSVARPFHAFLHFISFLVASRARHFPVIFIIEQHFWIRPLGSRVASSIYYSHS